MNGGLRCSYVGSGGDQICHDDELFLRGNVSKWTKVSERYLPTLKSTSCDR